MNEFEKIIPGYSKYTANTMIGTIVDTTTGQQINVFTNLAGYQYVHVYSDSGKRDICAVHRLVACTFCLNERSLDEISGLQVDHIDHVKSNNTAQNLRWCTQNENIEHTKCTAKTKRCRRIGLIDIETHAGFMCYSLRDAAKFLGVAEMSLHEWMNKTGNGRPYHGYHVGYVD